MTVITLGTGATIITPTLEEMLVALIDFGQSAELNTTKNPSKINNITSSVNRDTEVLIASVNLPCNFIDAENLQVIGVDYLVGVAFTFGTGESTLKGTNWVDAIIRTTIKQKSLEMDSAKNPALNNYIDYSIASSQVVGTTANATFSAQYSLPIAYQPDVFPASYKGSPYLL